MLQDVTALICNENYDKAWKLLEEQYGNKETLIASHMSRLHNLKTLFSDKDIEGIREFYDSILLDVRSLESPGVEPEHYGALLIPIVIGKLPPKIRLIINRKLGEVGYSLPKLLDFLTEEIQVREKSNSPIHLEERSDSRSAGKNDNITSMTAALNDSQYFTCWC